MVGFGVLVLILGDEDQQIIGAGALLIALIHAGMAVGQWPELRGEAGQADRERPS
jgi:hypothetical protein